MILLHTEGISALAVLSHGAATAPFGRAGRDAEEGMLRKGCCGRDAEEGLSSGAPQVHPAVCPVSSSSHQRAPLLQAAVSQPTKQCCALE